MISIYQILFHALILEEATQKMPEICTNNYFTVYEANSFLGNPSFSEKEQLLYKSFYVCTVLQEYSAFYKTVFQTDSLNSLNNFKDMIKNMVDLAIF